MGCVCVSGCVHRIIHTLCTRLRTCNCMVLYITVHTHPIWNLKCMGEGVFGMGVGWWCGCLWGWVFALKDSVWRVYVWRGGCFNLGFGPISRCRFSHIMYDCFYFFRYRRIL